MASTNSINTEQSGNMRQKTCLLGLITIAAAFGLVSSPARAQNAADVNQSSDQYTVQQGVGNSSVNASNQAGSISQGQSYKYIPHYGGFNHGEINAANLTQRSGQGVQQSGVGNSAIQAGAQSTSVQQH